MVMNFMQKIYFGMVFHLNNMTADWESEPEDEPEEELKQLLQEVKQQIGSLRSTAEELTAIVKEDFDTDIEGDGPAR